MKFKNNEFSHSSSIVVILLLSSWLLVYPFSSPVYPTSRENDQRLAEMFAPILVMTENPTRLGRIVLHPEPVAIVGAQSISNLCVKSYLISGSSHYSGKISDSPSNIRKLADSRVNFVENKFAYLSTPLRGNGYVAGLYLDYPGDDPDSWNAAYLPGKGQNDSHAGKRFRNTVYAQVFSRDTDDTYGPVVIKYYSFYPFNAWQNNHEGDWPKVNVMVTSRDTSTAEFHGVDYIFHGKSITYTSYSTSPSTHNIRGRISPVGGNYPVVYVSAGGHGHYPTPGNYQDVSSKYGIAYDDDLSPHGTVLHPEIDTDSEIGESYDVVLLPDPVPSSENDNMGLIPEMSWLGANVMWGETGVDSPGDWSPFDVGNDSPSGPFYSGWGKIRFDKLDHDEYPKFRIPSKFQDFHNFPIVGAVTWNGSVSLRGDIVVFPGATLTIKPGTVIEFEAEKDIHKFSGQGYGNNDLGEIFVYGTLTTESGTRHRGAYGALVLCFARLLAACGNADRRP